MPVVTTALIAGATLGQAATIGIGVYGTAAAIGSTAYNASQAKKATKEAKKQAAAAQASEAAVRALSYEEWAHYQQTYEPVMKKATALANRAIPAGQIVNQAMPDVTRQAIPEMQATQQAMMQMGVSPNAGTAQNVMRGMGNAAAIQDAGARIGLRQAADTTAFNRKLAIAGIGRGIPASVGQGYAAKARTAAGLEEQYAEMAGQAAQNAVSALQLGA